MTMALIAILRGLEPGDASWVGEVLYDAGLRAVEVPLGSPQPLESITRLRQCLPDDSLVGAGTVLSAEQVAAVHGAGGGLIVSPNTDAEVIRATLGLGLTSCPGAATPTEALCAVAAGARALKVFPAQQVTPAGLRAWTDVLPKDVELLPVGGVAPAAFASWAAAGATGFGLGAFLFSPGTSAAELRERARAAVSAWDALC
jgi:2-dehydro-3-deoxyphosphogalactonate aldolase